MGELFNFGAPRSRFKAFLDAAIKHHGEKALVLPAVFERREREDEIVARRNVLTKPEHRFFLPC